MGDTLYRLSIFCFIAWATTTLGSIGEEEKQKPSKKKSKLDEVLDHPVRTPTLEELLSAIDQGYGALPSALAKRDTKTDSQTKWQNIPLRFDPKQLGGNSSGGGSVVRRKSDKGQDIHSPWMLLDSYTNPQFPIRKARKDLTPTLLERTPFHEATGIDLVDIVKTSAFAHMVDCLRQLDKNQTRLALMITGVFRHQTKLFFSFNQVKRYKDFYLPQSLIHDGRKDLTVRTVILYDRLFGPIINAKLWNQLTVEVQAGLLIHEAFRYFRSVHPAAISEKQLQLLTSALLFDKSEKKFDLNKVFGPPLIEATKRPGWDNDADMTEGVRFRLYYRRVLEQLTSVRETIDKETEKYPTAAKIIEGIPRLCRSLNIHERFEIECASYYLGRIPGWVKRLKEVESPLESVFAAMELRDGSTALMWEWRGEPSPFFEVFLTKLFVANGTNFDDLPKRTDLIHAWLLRQKLNAKETISADDKLDQAFYASQFQKYFGNRVWSSTD